MKIIDFNTNWTYAKLGEEKKSINLPHDAMIYENRSITSKGGINISYYEGYDYEYEKKFLIEKELLNKIIVIEFEGIYKDATIFLNNQKIAFNNYGYNGFYVDITPYVKEGENVLKVQCRNSDQPNSRWYTGSGIYREVKMLVLEQEHILIDGIKIKTLSYEKKLINIDIETNSKGDLNIEFIQNGKIINKAKTMIDKHYNANVTLTEGKLWSDKDPNLIEVKVKFIDDIQIVRFGIRQIELSLEKGLLINGKRTILLGACIHHDNGLIGARNIPFADYRKVKLIKEAGYNAIRSAHNPCSKAILNACDELGIFVLDEYVDCWYIHKTYYDYALHMEKNWQDDLTKMVNKDFNHPSVIMYSIGNEVSETGQKKGIELTKLMTDFLHTLDDRPVTCGVNIFFNFLSSMNFGVYSDKKAKKELENNKAKKSSVGSQFFNDLAGIMGASFMKRGATLSACDRKTRDAFANMDVAGYNYGIERYKHDLKKYPKRFILGTETFCSDADRFYQMALDNPRLIGDFVWSGMDYIGEVGVGSWTVDEYCENDFSHQLGWLTAGSGRIDITGKMNSEVDYTKVAFNQEKIAIGVVPVHHHKRKHSPSSWKFSLAEKSWTYEGLEGKQTIVEVYTKAKFVELYLNNQLLKRKSNNKCIVKFKIKYYPGELVAKAYDENKLLIGETSLKTADKETILIAKSEIEKINKGDLIYLRFKFSDSKGILKPMLKSDIKIDRILNGKLLGFGNGCSYSKRGYITDINNTFYGEATAVIQPTYEGDVIVEASSKYGNSTTKIELGEN